jgi:LysM repeat protein
MLRYTTLALALVVTCWGQSSPVGGSDVFPTQEDRIADLEARVQQLELQVGILQGTIVVKDGLYQLRPGDSGSIIARRFSMSLADLFYLNPKQNWTKLKVGEFVRVYPKSVTNQSTPLSQSPSSNAPPSEQGPSPR